MIESVHIKGFRSLADVELLGIPKAAVLIGANGSGKSNFIRFFEMLRWMLGPRRLAEFVEMQGGADDQLYGGSHRTSHIKAEIQMRAGYEYRFMLSFAHPDRFFFSEESFRGRNDRSTKSSWRILGSGHREAEIVGPINRSELTATDLVSARVIADRLRSCVVYQFHNTSETSAIKRSWDVEDINSLLSHGGNLAAVLLWLERHDIRRYELICQQIGRVLPVFDRFHIEERYGKARLRWKAKSTDKTFGAHLTSDGSLRFFALVTLLNLPSEMLSDVLLLDEPELGLHPTAVSLVGGMIKALAEERQVIVATQSPLLVDAFDLDEIFVLELHDGCTEFHKLSASEYEVWLDDNFTTGELWQKNLLGGRP